LGSLRPVLLTLITVCGAAAQTSTINTFAGNNAAGAGFSGDGMLATAAQLNVPGGVAIDSAGNVYIADTRNSRIRVVNAAGIISTFAGNGTAVYSGDGGLATNAGLIAPSSVAVDSSGNVYIADPQAAVIRKVTSGFISTFAGIGTATFSGDGGPAASAGLNFPSAVAVDSSGNVYIADTLNQRIRKISAGNITTIAGISNLGFNGDNQSATLASLFAPQGVAVDAAGNVFIADTQNNRIRKVTAGVITTVAGNGTPGYLGDHGAATTAELNLPKAVALDLNGNIYISDYNNNVVRRVSNSVIVTAAGSNLSGYTGDGGPATSADMFGPLGLAIDPTGAFTYIADSGNNVIRVVTNTINSGVIPHFAAGGSYVTGLYVINKSASPQTFSINFYNDAGTQIAVPTTGGTTTGMTLTDTIAALGTGYYELGVLTPNGTALGGSAVIQSSPSLLVQGLFRHQGAGPSPYEAAVQSTVGSFEAEFAFDGTTYAPSGLQVETGVAVANIDQGNAATITCVARDNTGTVISNAFTVPTLNPLGHFASVSFPALTGLRGTVDCTSNTRIGVVALRAIGDAISTLPVILK
jgi:sugar lactone lactonase YvrE